MLDLMGISSVANVLGAIRLLSGLSSQARTSIVVWTDSMELYESRLRDLRESEVSIRVGRRDGLRALSPGRGYSQHGGADLPRSQRSPQPQVLHWVSSRGRVTRRFRRSGYQDDYWTGFQGQIEAIDALITDFTRVRLQSDSEVRLPVAMICASPAVGTAVGTAVERRSEPNAV